MDRFSQEHEAALKFRDFRLLALDGTEIDVPNWKALRAHFGQAKNKSGKHRPQARMVMLLFPFVRLPFGYELVPLSQGENTVARRLVQHLRPRDLVLLDAGFWSYGVLCDMASRGAFFAIRLSGTAKLKFGKWLGKSDRLATWTPCDSRGQWRAQGLPPNISLRVIQYQVPGFRKIATA